LRVEEMVGVTGGAVPPERPPKEEFMALIVG
jgi:hypothetical protein